MGPARATTYLPTFQRIVFALQLELFIITITPVGAMDSLRQKLGEMTIYTYSMNLRHLQKVNIFS